VAEETLADRVKRLRLARGLSHSDLASKIGVTEGAIRHIETGETQEPKLPLGAHLAELLGVSAYYLWFGREPSGVILAPGSGKTAAVVGARVAAATPQSEPGRLGELEERADILLEALKRVAGILVPIAATVADPKVREEVLELQRRLDVG
jgi:transcriptional regulator with XRE-family HTH domain